MGSTCDFCVQSPVLELALPYLARLARINCSHEDTTWACLYLVCSGRFTQCGQVAADIRSRRNPRMAGHGRCMAGRGLAYKNPACDQRECTRLHCLLLESEPCTTEE